MPTWEIRIQRNLEQTLGRRTRTVGSYQVFRDGVAATEPLLSGTTAETRGPGSNDASAIRKRCIAPGRYPLVTSGGPKYLTTGYRLDLLIRDPLPGIELSNTGARSAIIIHPGKNAFLSSVGCINPCTRLPTPAERIDYAGSRDRVIALINDMAAFLGGIPGRGDRPIPNAFAVILG
jgi:hypothetical protein